MILVALTGCGFNPFVDDRVDMTNEALVGTWEDKKDGGVWTFGSDGSVVATGLPGQMIKPFPDVWPAGLDANQTTFSASGRWTLSTRIGEEDGPHNRITLLLDVVGSIQNAATGGELSVGRQGDVTVLNLYVDDSDAFAPYTYHKRA